MFLRASCAIHVVRDPCEYILPFGLEPANGLDPDARVAPCRQRQWSGCFGTTRWPSVFLYRSHHVRGESEVPPLCVWGLHACGWGCPMKTCTLLVLGVAQGWFAKLRPLPCQQHPPWKQTTSGMQTGLPLPTIRYASFPLVTAANCAVLWFHLAMHIRPERTA